MKKTGVMVLLIKKDKILFLIRNKKNEDIHQTGIYLPIGGKVEKGEGLEECAIREVMEESSIKINKLTLKGILYTRSLPNDTLNDWVNFLFVSENFSGKPKDGNEGSFEWVSIADISKIPLYEGERVFLENVLKHKFYLMESVHKGYDLISYKILASN
jgi:8-oxo-dGTP diphosphatase